MTQNSYHYIRQGQPGSELFTFVVGVEDLIVFAQIDRFNETDEGVERKLTYPHVQRLVEYMRRPNANLPEPILGDLRGGWEFDAKQHVVKRGKNAKLCVDDGQHRIAAFHLLKSEEQAKWEVVVTVTVNTSYQERLKKFLQQLTRLKLDGQLVLQIMDRGDLWPDQTSKAVYQLAKRLATDSTSPLKGLIRLEERASKRLPTGTDAETLKPILGELPPAVMLRESTIGMINVMGILRDIQKVTVSIHSALKFHNAEQQYRLIVCLLEAAAKIWPKAWDDPKHFFLRRSVGIGSLIQLFIVGRAFKDCVSETLKKSVLAITPETKDSIFRTLHYANEYDWSYAQFRAPNLKFPQAVDIAKSLDYLINQKMPRSGEARRRSSAKLVS